MARMTYYETMLVRVREAIREIVEGGARSATISWGGGSQSYTRLDLDKLMEMEQRYLAIIARQRGGADGMRVRPDFGG